jgi:hypothetical protein
MNRHLEALKAIEIKPKMGQPCNNCGWCCIRETCPVGVELSPPGDAVCAMLVPKDGKYFCKLSRVEEMRHILDIGGGCDAISVREKLEALMT